MSQEPAKNEPGQGEGGRLCDLSLLGRFPEGCDVSRGYYRRCLESLEKTV